MKRFFSVLVLSCAMMPFMTGCGDDSGSAKQPKMSGEPKPGGVGPAALPSSPGGGGGKAGGGGANPGAAVE